MKQEDYLVDICEKDGDRYRFGFNGMVKDNELKGIGNSINYEARIYDTRLGRFLSIDPLTADFPWYTPYQFAGNTPIQAIDLDGAEEYHYTRIKDKSGKTTSLKLYSTKDLYEWQWNPDWKTKTLWTKVKNKSQSYVVQQMQKRVISSDAGLKYYNEDESASFSSYNAALNSTDADFANTALDWAHRAVQGAVNVGDEARQGRVPGALSSSRGSPISAKSSAIEYAQSIINTRSKSNTPLTVTAIVDTKTGKVYHGESQGLRGQNINSKFRKMLPSKTKEDWPVTNCSECDALNTALNDGAKMSNLEMHTVQIKKSTGTISDRTRCDNCMETTQGIQNVTSDK